MTAAVINAAPGTTNTNNKPKNPGLGTIKSSNSHDNPGIGNRDDREMQLLELPTQITSQRIQV